MRKDGTYLPESKARCQGCGLVIQLLPVDGSDFPRWQWKSRHGDRCEPTHAREGRSTIHHRPVRPGIGQTLD